VEWIGPDDGQDVVKPIVYHRVGGNTKMYGALLHRQRPEDFTRMQHKEGISPEWCVGYDEFEPYYMMAEHVMKIHGNAGEDKTAGHRSGPYPFKAFPHEGRIAEVVKDLQGLGLNVHHSNLALNRDIDEPWKRPCIACNTCDPFPCMLHAKSDAETSLVRPALKHKNVTLWTNSRVDKLVEENGNISRIELEKDGEKMELSADIVIVSCGAINSAALLLKSKVANSSDQVGRNFTKHNQSGISALNPDKPNDVVFQKNYTRILGDYAHLNLTDEQAKRMQRLAVDFWFTSEDLPTQRKTVQWTEKGIKFNYAPNNRESHFEFLDYFQNNYLKKAGFSEFYRSTKNLEFTWHQAGTAQFGTDPKTSVLDPNCKAWDLGNLYVVDASFQPSQGATNPTLTIIANAIRVAEHIKTEWFAGDKLSTKDFPLSDGYMADNAGANIEVSKYVAGDEDSWGA